MLAGLFLFIGVIFADFIGNRIVGGAVNQLLSRMGDSAFRRRSFAIMVWNFTGRTAKKRSGGVTAQMQLPGSAKVQHACKREDASYRTLKRGKTYGQVPSGRVSSDAESLKVEFGNGIVLVFEQGMVSAANVLKRPWPAAAGISHATVFHIPCGNTEFLQGIAEMPGVSEVVFGAPVAPMNEENHWVRSFSCGNPYVRKLIRVLPVGKAQIGVGWFFAENSFALHGKKYRTATRRGHSARKKIGQARRPARD